MSGPPAEREALLARMRGRSRNGNVFVRNFDQGIVETLGSFKSTVQGKKFENYFLAVEGISYPPGLPGIPVTFFFPEDIWERWKLPVLVVRRDDISPAFQRWHSVGATKYRTPADTASPVVASGLRGFDRYEEQAQAWPFDISYTLSVQARTRGDYGQKNAANRILKHVLRVYPPYGRVIVKDDIGDVRTYEAFMEGVSGLDEAVDISDRMMSFSVSVRVEAELDLSDPLVYRAARNRRFDFNPMG